MTTLQNSNDTPPAPTLDNTSPPTHHSSLVSKRLISQPNKPTRLSDLSNMNLDLSQRQAQSSRKWVRVLKPAHFGDNQPLESSLGKRNSYVSQIITLPSKYRALDGAKLDENSFPTADANLQLRRAQ